VAAVAAVDQVQALVVLVAAETALDQRQFLQVQQLAQLTLAAVAVAVQELDHLAMVQLAVQV
jgi:hypothetical protein